MHNSPNLTTLLVFFLGVGLCLWRVPQADRWHVALCLVAAALWSCLPLIDPATRTSGFGFVVATFLIGSLSQPARRRAASRFPR